MPGLLPITQIRKRLKEFIKSELDGICAPLKYYKVKKDDTFANLKKGEEILIIEDSEKKLAYLHLGMKSKRFSLSHYTCFLHKATDFESKFNKVCFFTYFQTSSLSIDAKGAYIESEENLEKVLLSFRETLKDVIIPQHNRIQTLRDIFDFEKIKYYTKFLNNPELDTFAYLLLHQKICESEKVDLMYAAMEKFKAKCKSKLSEEDFNEEMKYMLPIMKEFDSFRDNQELIERGWLTKEDIVPSSTPEEVEYWYRKTRYITAEERDKEIQDFVDMYGFRL